LNVLYPPLLHADAQFSTVHASSSPHCPHNSAIIQTLNPCTCYARFRLRIYNLSSTKKFPKVMFHIPRKPHLRACLQARKSYSWQRNSVYYQVIVKKICVKSCFLHKSDYTVRKRNEIHSRLSIDIQNFARCRKFS